MMIKFKYKGLPKNRPKEKKHIDIQAAFRKKLTALLKPFKHQLMEEPAGFLVINYVDKHIDHLYIKIFN